MLYFKVFLTLLFACSIFLTAYNLLGDDQNADAHAQCCNAVVPASFLTSGYQQYREQCGRCHMAYPPMLLPTASWKKLWDARDHFGRPGIVPPSAVVRDVVLADAADVSTTRLARKFRDAPQEASSLPRITDADYMLRKHPKIYEKLLEQANNVELANCRSCHQEAEKGIFCSEQVVIPH